MKTNMTRNELKVFLLHAPQDKVLEYLENAHPVDILDILKEDEKNDCLDILNRLPENFIAEIIDEAEDEDKYKILMSFSDNKQKNILQEMSSDEVTDLLGILEKDQADRILQKMTTDDARNVRRLLSYEPDTAAGIMATEFVAIKGDMTVEQTLKYLQKTGEDIENIDDLYVVDKFDKLIGVVALKDLVVKSFDTHIMEIINPNVMSIPSNMDQEEVGHKFEKYGSLTMPVVDNFSRLLGIVTVDDVMQILRDESTEDIHRLGGVDEGEKISGTTMESVRSRLPWLVVNLFTAILASAVVGVFQGTIEKVVALATLMPIVTGMGGNAGTQTLTVIVRGLALGELNYENEKRVLFKEVGIGTVTGVVIGLIIGIMSFIWQGNAMLGVVMALAMILNMVVATVTGYLVPLILKKLKADPALASSIFVTTFTDCCGFFFFLGLATVFMRFLI